MVGDFNEILSGEDKFGGSQINLNRAMVLRYAWMHVGLWIWVLQGLSLSGPIKGKLRGPIRGKLQVWGKQTILFQTMWITHPNFPRVAREAWLKNNSLLVAILNFTT